MDAKAKAAVFCGPKKEFEIREYPVLPAPSGYGRSSLLASGVCGTDLHIHRGKLDNDPETIIGHEFVGRLDDINAQDNPEELKPGDNVIADIAVPCGKCPLCLAGDDANCVNLGVTNAENVSVAPHLYGGYAAENFTPVANLIKIPEGLDPVTVAGFACPGPTVFHSLALAKRAGVDISAKEFAVVQGAGPVGLFAALALKALGVKKVIAVAGGRNPGKTEKLRTFGIDEVISLSETTEDGLKDRILELTGGLGADLCVECSGIPSAFGQALGFLRLRGVYLVPGQYSVSDGITINPEIITFNALHIIGSSQYSVCDVKEYLGFLTEHPDITAKLSEAITTYHLSDVNRAFRDAEAGLNIKTVLIPD